MASIGWLHLTDLHFGLPGQKWLWPTVREQFYADLERLHAKSGPWDLVLFTGDLTQRGSKDEFDRLTEALGKLWNHLAKLGSKPALVTVPGNHDLQRPKVTPTVRALRNWHTDADLREEFWGTANSEYRTVVNDAFAAYEGFVNARPLPEGLMVRQGTLPGDRLISLKRDGLKLALVGLNTAFLQLEGGDYQGKLDLDVRQLHGVCGDDPPEWFGTHHATLLLTHHPTTWLHPRALSGFKAEIAPPGRFVAHLFGHMHEGSTTSLSVSGSSPQRAVQGPSLFGLETWGKGTQQRIHGYMAGRITLDNTQGTFLLWPRELRKNRAGAWQMTPDGSFELHEEATCEELWARLPAARGEKINSPASPSHDRVKSHVAYEKQPKRYIGPELPWLPGEPPPFAASGDRRSVARIAEPKGRKSLHLEAASKNMPGLIKILERLHGYILQNRYRIESIHRMGSQFIVFRGMDLDLSQPVAIKIPMLDYTRPASFGVRDVRAGRSAVVREWEVLCQYSSTSGALPQALSLVVAPNALLATRADGKLGADEHFLVEEWIEGDTIDEIRQSLFAEARPSSDVGKVIEDVAHELLIAVLGLAPGVFVDVASRNFVRSHASGRVRIVDAGSVVAEGTTLWSPSSTLSGPATLHVPLTLCYLPQKDFVAYKRGERTSASSGLMLLAVGRVLHELATNLHPLDGIDPAPDAPQLNDLPDRLRRLIANLARADNDAAKGIVHEFLSGGRA